MFTKTEIMQISVGSGIAQNDSARPEEIITGH